jgi:hypothetical protein
MTNSVTRSQPTPSDAMLIPVEAVGATGQVLDRVASDGDEQFGREVAAEEDAGRARDDREDPRQPDEGGQPPRS